VHNGRKLRFGVWAMPMPFRGDRPVSEEDVIVLYVAGRVYMECVNTIKKLMEKETTTLAFNLSEVTLANRDAACEHKGIGLRKCPAFLRVWIDKEQERITS
jgi:hypothetical protein